MSINNKISTLFILATLLLLYNSPNVDSAAPTAAPSPAVDCYSVILEMADCITYVSDGSTLNKPEGKCCSGLKKVLKVDPECLCEGFKNSINFGVVLNISKAINLPSVCHVSAPPFSNCGITLGPSAVPVSPPNSGPSELAPAPSPGKSASSTFSVSLVFLVLNLIAASFSLL